MELSFRPMTGEDTAVIQQWRYDDVDEKPGIGRAGSKDFTAVSGGKVVGYCSFGERAMIPGYLDTDHFVGVAWGLLPALVGGGHGRCFLQEVVALGRKEYPSRRLQAVIKKANVRSLRAAKGVGFFEIDEVRDRIVLQML